jgi:hypothetical protein
MPTKTSRVDIAAGLNRPSLNQKIEINMANTTEVSRKADTKEMGETVIGVSSNL